MNQVNKMDPKTARQVLEEFALRNADLTKIADYKEIDFGADLFDKQEAFIMHSSRRKAALCGRRSGKTVCCAYYLVKTAYERKCDVAYIALSRQSAKNIIWNEIVTILERYKIKYETNQQALQITLANGSRIILSGASSEREVEKHRGMYYALVIIDECGAPQFLPLLENMVYNVLLPTLFDTDGTICLISSPGPICAGLFYRITEGFEKNWKTFKWTVKDNPKFPRWSRKKDWRELAEELLGSIKEENGWDEESPVFRREWKGEWVKEAVSLVYKFDADINLYSQLPNDIKNWDYIFGIDFGVADSSAIVVGAYSLDSPVLYIIDCFKKNQLSPGEVADVTKGYYEKYEPVSIDADANGMGLAFIMEIEKRHQLPIEKAEKQDKVGFIEIMNDEFKKGRIKIKETLVDLLEEITKLQWRDIENKILPEDAEDHLCDAMLYMWRRSLHYTGKLPKKTPKVGTMEWEDELLEQVKDKYRAKEGEAWWEKL